MKRVTRRGLLKGGIFGGFGILTSGLDCWDAVSYLPGGEYIETIEEAYGYNASLPPKSDSRYAVKLYAWSDNCLNDPKKVLGASDNKYARFACTPDSPLELVVGFGKEFKRVWMINFHDGGLDVEGGAATPVVLFGAGDAVKYVFNGSRKESGYADPNPRCEMCSGGDIQIDTGSGNERIFKIIATPYDEQMIEIDSFVIE